MRPIVSQDLNWSSAIGLFLLNFGALEITLLEILKGRVKEEGWNALKKESFHDRVLRLRKLGSDGPYEAIDDGLLKRLAAVKDDRNHLAHSTLVNSFSEDLKSCTQKLVLINDYAFAEDGEDGDEEVSVEDDEVSMEKLLQQNQDLADLVGEMLAILERQKSEASDASE